MSCALFYIEHKHIFTTYIYIYIYFFFFFLGYELKVLRCHQDKGVYLNL